MQIVWVHGPHADEGDPGRLALLFGAFWLFHVQSRSSISPYASPMLSSALRPPSPTPDMLLKLRWAPGELPENYEPGPVDLQGSMAQSRDQGKLEESVFAPLSALGCFNFDSCL